MNEPAPGDTKPCPYCGELLKAGALVCRFCRRDLFNPDALPNVAVHDWERETPVESVTYTVRLPISERQWATTCYLLAAAVGTFWVGLATRPPVGAATPARRARATPTPEPAGLLAPGAFRSPGGTEAPRATPTLEPTPESDPAPTATPDAGASPEPAGAWTATPGEGGVPTTDAPSDDGTFTFEATALIALYDDRPDYAEDRFTRETLTVSGKVEAVGIGGDGAPFVLLHGTSDTRVKCLFTGGKGKPAPSVKVGDAVTIRGSCQGRFVDVLLTECALEL